MKKIFTLLVLLALMISGCGTKEEDSQATIIRLGMISHLNAGEKQMEEYLSKIQAKTHAKVLNHVPVYFDSLRQMQMGLEASNIDRISVYTCVANYLLANNDKFEAAKVDWISGLEDNFCFAVRQEDSQLKTDLDKVIDEMKDDGSLAKLTKDYILNVDKENPPAVEIPKIDGAETIKIGVTGDLPPLDLILADNSPAGFNTALLAEIAKRLNKNVEVVQIDSGARATALNADQIDVIFWVVVPEGDNFPADIDKAEGVELSAPYFKDNIAHIKLKK